MAPRAEDPLARILRYQQESGHSPNRPAPGPAWLDWETQPDPVRRYDGAPQRKLPRVPPGPTPPYEPAFLEGRLSPVALDVHAIGQLLGDALGLSAWKEAGTARWALRTNPSSGNLHPTEGTVVLGALPGLSEQPGVWHYQPYAHALEQRASLPGEVAETLPPGGLLLGLTSIHWREAWKYGERALRYCHHDVGHAIGAVAMAAAALGWRTRLLEGVEEAELAILLGVADQRGPEAEHPDALLWIGPAAPEDWRASGIAAVLLSAAREARWQGRPRALSASHEAWPAIEEAHRATTRVGQPGCVEVLLGPQVGLEIGDAPFGIREIVHQRRSAVEMDGQTGISQAAFVQILRKCWPGDGQLPFSVVPWRARVHLIFFAQRVAGVKPGIYLLARDPEVEGALRGALDPGFSWERPGWAPEELPLWLLQEGDVRGLAAGLSCGQAIAGDGCFAVAMLGDFQALEELGPWFWRRLHWEAGLVGQLLYLEAEASGIRGTGIGCFYDAATHRALGMRGARFRDLYHFTVGGPVEDPRIRTLPVEEWEEVMSP